jgi:hypothetical protein
MLKSVIIAAASIAYILSTVNTADAKIQKSNKTKIFKQELACQNPVKPSPQYNQVIAKNAGLKEDVRAVCQLINKRITDANLDSIQREESTNPAAKIDQELHGIEVKDIRIVSNGTDEFGKLSKIDYSGKTSTIYAEINSIDRVHLWDRSRQQWKLSTIANYVERVTFSKEGGQWKQVEYKIQFISKKQQ